MIKIEINNQTKNKIPRQAILALVQRAARLAARRGIKQLSLAFVSVQKMQELNRRYRRKNKITDVLSFRYPDRQGEIVICLSQAKKQAVTGYQKEILQLVLHGFLHLHGFDHEKSARQAKQMACLAEKILGS